MAAIHKIVSIEFLQNHLPSLLSGKYRAYAEQVVSADELVGNSRKNFSTPVMGGLQDAQYFYVSGPRYKIDKGSVQHIYPPNDGNGDYMGNLPTLFLTRSTLPWERYPNYQNTGSNTPWLALLLFDEDDFRQGNVKVGASTLGQFPFSKDCGAVDDLEYDPTIKIDTITIQNAKDILPKDDDLQWMAHARIPYIKNGSTTTPEEEIAVVMANRLPTPGKKNTVFLVSMESYFDQFAFGTHPPTHPSSVLLLTFYKWQFYCSAPTTKNEGSFENYLQNIDLQALALNKKTTNADAQSLLNQGHVPLIHWLRNGGHCISWFRGPLAPGPVTDQNLPLSTGSSSDSFLIFHSKTGMFNVSYAAAWEIGRQMGIENIPFSNALFDFKNTLQQSIIAGKQNTNIGDYSHLAVKQPPDSPVFSLQLLQILAEWKLLHHLPFSYLIGNPEMLPNESLRFFSVDANWINAFLYGAFGLGYFPELDSAIDFSSLIMDPINPITGFLIRSRTVKDWPNLHVDAYPTKLLISDTSVHDPVQKGAITLKSDIDEAITALNHLKIPSTISSLVAITDPLTVIPADATHWWLIDYTNNRYFLVQSLSTSLDVSEHFTLPILRMEKLAEDVLLILFGGNPKTIDFYLKPGQLHSGFEPNGISYEKVLRDPNTGVEYSTAPLSVTPIIGFYPNVLDMNSLAKDILTTISKNGYTGLMTAAEYGLEMIEAVPKVRFDLS